MADFGRMLRFVVVPSVALIVAAATLTAASSPAQSDSKPPAGTLATDAAREAFLQNAEVVRARSVGKGVTDTLRATLTDGTITHDASIQTIDDYKAIFQGAQGTELNFRDSWRYNVAAYQLDRLLELGMVPTTVERTYRGKRGSFTWWVDDVIMDEQEHYRKKRQAPDALDWNQQMWTTRLFDQLVANVDRNLGNLLIDKDWNAWMIDHSRAFRLNATPRTPGNLTRVERRLFEHLRAMTFDSVQGAVGEYLTKPEIEAMLKRRDFIVAHFEKGGPALVFDHRPRCC